ncbi:MAG TPA: YneF family protein [Candidatus Onthovivens sp.]|nr:YneF family protein [Candidatus Onthovivens sp.]
MIELEIGFLILYIILGLLAGLVAGFFISRFIFKRQLQKNPPINEKMIRAMYLQMGRKASESQIRAIMNSMKQNK